MKDRTTELFELIVLTVFSMFAVNTIIVDAGLLFGATLSATMPFWCITQVAVLAAAAVALRPILRGGAIDFVAAAGLTAIATIVVVSVMARPLRSGDDWGYMIRAAYAAIDPDRSISVSEPGLVPPLGFPNYYNLPYAIEFFSAYLAELTGLSFLTVYHQLLRALCGALLPLVWFVVLRRFAGGRLRAAVILTAFVIAALFLAGAEINGFAGITLDRIWMNKGILVALVFPAGLAYLLDYLESGRFIDWCKLALLGVVAGGLGLNAFHLWPAYLALLSLAFIGSDLLARSPSVATGPRAKLALLTNPAKRLVVAALSQSYLIAVMIGYRALSDPKFGTWNPNHPGEIFLPTTRFLDQLCLVFQAPWAPEFLVPLIATVLALKYYKGQYRPFLFAWIVLLALTFYNPLFYWLLVETWGSPLLSSYWRFFYLAPFPLVAGLAASALLPAKGEVSAKSIAAAVVGIAALIGLAFTVPVGLTVTPAPTWPSPSLSADRAAVLAAIDRQSPPGPVLALEWIGANMPVLYPNRPQILTFTEIALHYATWSGDYAEARRRLLAVDFLNDPKERNRKDFESVVRAYRPAAILFRENPRMTEVAGLMQELQYRRAPLPSAGFVLYVRMDGS